MQHILYNESNIKPRLYLVNVMKRLCKGRDVVRNTAGAYSSHTLHQEHKEKLQQQPYDSFSSGLVPKTQSKLIMHCYHCFFVIHKLNNQESDY